MERPHGTTILALRKGGQTVIAGDGQVSLGPTVIKHGARKVRRLFGDRILAGFAGSAADSFALFEKFEAQLDQHRGNLRRAAVELSKEWRSDRVLRRLEALLLVADKETLLVLSGSGDVIEPDDDVAAIGSGGTYALAAARALMRHSALDAETIAIESLRIAASICVYTNDSITSETLPPSSGSTAGRQG